MLLIKDHKKKNAEGVFPTRIIVPATNFTAGFAKLGYLGIKRIFNKENINYFSATIVQASDMKGKVEKKNFKENEVMVATLDIKNMYPSITFGVVKKAVSFYARNLKEERKLVIANCLKMIKFSMSNQLFGFLNKFY